MCLGPATLLNNKTDLPGCARPVNALAVRSSPAEPCRCTRDAARRSAAVIRSAETRSAVEGNACDG